MLDLQQAQGKVVQATPELYRVISLPRRTWDEMHAVQCARYLTQHLRTPLGRMELRNVQAIALWELHQCQGLFGIIYMGAGKTLISLLAPHMVSCQRPLLLVKGSLQNKTKRDILTLSRDWKIPRNIRIMSYELLGRPQAAHELEHYKPDLIVADECHKLKNSRAAVTRRVHRYMNANPMCAFVGMSGTVTKRSLKDYSRILRWCLKAERAPIPRQENELEEWADALDEKLNPLNAMHPGALVMLSSEGDSLGAIRRGYRNRLIQTPGVVATEHDSVDCSLTIQAVEPDMKSETDQAVFKLRSTWETPDEWPIADAITLWRHARELSLGFYYRWNPRPPDEWLEPRKAWASECRSIISSSRRFDSEGQVAQAIVNGEIKSQAYWDWKEVQDSFIPNTECVWLDYSVLEHAALWARTPGIVWVEHVFFGKLLAEVTGLRYYGQGGIDKVSGDFIENADPKRACIASIEANFEGRNLQHFSRNLIVSPPANNLRWGQLIARTHRSGQQADEVTVDVVMTCIEHYNAFEQAKADAEYARDTLGDPAKLLNADLLFPAIHEVMLRPNPRWQQ